MDGEGSPGSWCWRDPVAFFTGDEEGEREREREGLWFMDYGRKEKKGVNHQTSRTGTLSPYKSLGACFTLRTRLSRRVSWSDWTRRVFSQELVGSVRTSMLTCLKGGGSASVFVFKP